MAFNDRALYPYTYGDLVIDDGKRISDSVLKLINDPKFKNSLKSTFLLMIFIGSYSLPAKATDLNEGTKIKKKNGYMVQGRYNENGHILGFRK